MNYKEWSDPTNRRAPAKVITEAKSPAMKKKLKERRGIEEKLIELALEKEFKL
jgi:hypothetical protein